MFKGFIRRHGWPKVALLLLDCAAMTCAAIATFFSHYYSGFDEYDTQHSLEEYITRVGVLYLAFPLLVLIFRQHLLYKLKVYSTGVSQFAQLTRALLINALLLIAIVFFVREDLINHSRTNLILFTLFGLVFLSFFRIVIFRRYVLPTLTGFEVRRILLVGAGGEAQELMQSPGQEGSNPYEVVAVVDQNGSLGSMVVQALVLTHMPLLKDFVQSHNIHEVVVAENELPYEDVVRIIGEARDSGVPVHLLSDHFKVVRERVTRSSSEFLNVAAAPISHGAEGFYASYLKRVADILGALLGMLAISPVLITFALIVKVTSRGPLFFRTTVIGRDGVPFQWYKFRTMYTHTADEIHREHVAEHIRLGTRPTGKLTNDPRVTPIGRWLRKHSLDELPQLWNVLRGEMSLIGPRPCLPYEYEEYLNWHKERFVVRPGMTGLWQVSGRSSVSFNDMVILDLYYIHNMSLWLDAAIVLRTIGVVLTGKGGG